MSRIGLTSIILTLNLIVAGCGGALLRHWPQSTKHAPTQYELDSVPFYPQEAYQCGPASLAMALQWSGILVDLETLISEVFTPSRKGSLQPALIAAARRHERLAYAISGPDAMLAEIAAGHPVIVLQNLGLSWYPIWHYAVVIGYNLDQGVVILHSGVTSQKHVALRVFSNTWARSDYWGLLVLPPSRMPVTATEYAYISAVLGLEKAGRRKAAVEGYKTALDRWPRSFPAHMGLGNSYYALGDLESAESSFREATRRFPTEGSAFNNLAQVLWEQRKEQEALEAASKAVALGGPLVEEYRSTLREIQKGRP